MTELEIVTGPLAGRRLPLRGEVTVGRADPTSSSTMLVKERRRVVDEGLA
jgi:hypothetical protein